MKYIVLLFIINTISLCLFAQDSSEQAYKIYDVKNQKIIQLDALIKDIKTSDVLFFGEEHNDSAGHVLELEILTRAAQAYPGIALSMEMFATDVQPVIDEYLLHLISEKNFIKESKAWNNYKDYKPLIEFAKENQLNVIAANAAVRYSNAVTYGGLEVLKKFPPMSKIFFPPIPIDTASGRYHEKFVQTLGGHDMGNMKIYQTQNFWDATMAWSIATYLKKNPKKKIFQINGRFHSDEKLGIMMQLKKYAPGLRTTNISCFPSADFINPDWKKISGLADYIIISSEIKKQGT